jgi:hypothetical protein
MTGSATQSIEVSTITPAFLRWGLGGFGLAIALVALLELWRGVWPISVVTPFFGLLLGIGVCAGGGLMLGALFGPDEEWSITPGRLTIRQSLRGTGTRLDFGPAQIASISVETHDWDSRPASYYLAIRLVTGKLLKSPEFGTKAKAQAAMDMLNAPD